MIDIRISEEFISKPKFHNRIDRSGSSQDVYSKPLEASNAFGQSHIKTSWLELTYFLRTASYSSRSQKEVIAKLIAFCISEKLSRARSGPRNNPHNFLLRRYPLPKDIPE
jgi:hypothetical protein